MNRKLFAAGASCAVILGSLGVLGATTSAQAVTPTKVTVSFTSDTPGAKPNGYASPDSPSMLFFDTIGANLNVTDFGAQSHGQAIGVSSDDASALEVRFTSPTTAISMSFGNDDPIVANATDLAQLTLFRGATQVGQVQVNVNANDLMDQKISFGAGPLFNRAVFQYVSAAGTPLGLIEIVDDIAVNPLCTISGNSLANTLVGTAGRDVICGDAGGDIIKGGGGNDLIYPGKGNDTTNAGAGNDTVLDNAGNDIIIGGAGKDDIRGSSGNDQLQGGPGADLISGATGRDSLNGGPGGDTCNGGLARDTAKNCEIRIRIP
ncbi:calcium-binding protein [Nocardioides sp.]|uniref:calcium-binding protein n=1 Tax=Nocardioides sp. TaxID=35761 RepID=UPI003D0F516C